MAKYGILLSVRAFLVIMEELFLPLALNPIHFFSRILFYGERFGCEGEKRVKWKLEELCIDLTSLFPHLLILQPTVAITHLPLKLFLQSVLVTSESGNSRVFGDGSVGRSCYCSALLEHSFLGFLFFFLSFYFFLDSGEGREKERERNLNVWLPLTCTPLGTWPTTQACALTGNWTGDLLACSPCSIHWATPARARIIMFYLYTSLLSPGKITSLLRQ